LVFEENCISRRKSVPTTLTPLTQSNTQQKLIRLSGQEKEEWLAFIPKICQLFAQTIIGGH
jgi:hypothetical protein